MTEKDARNWPAALCLSLIAAPLAEILSENQPILNFLQPKMFIILTLAYGLPVLLIRELAAARRMGVPGIFLLGLAYGLFNEGILAKTLTQPSGPPVGPFAGMGQVGMLQTGWALMIVPWHALHSVLYPLLLTHWLFPAASGRRWLGKRPAWVLVAILAVSYVIYFLQENRREISTFVFYVTATIAFIAGSLRIKSREGVVPAPARLRPALIGMAFILFYMAQFVAAGRLPFPLYAPATCGIYGLLVWRMGNWRPVPETLLFGLGDYLTFAAFAAFIKFHSGHEAMQGLFAGVVFSILFPALMRAVKRAPGGRGTENPAPVGA